MYHHNMVWYQYHTMCISKDGACNDGDTNIRENADVRTVSQQKRYSDDGCVKHTRQATARWATS